MPRSSPPPQADASPARDRVLDAAEVLFSARGYAAVTLKDIAGALGMRQASLYYHVPGGKEALFIEVTERSFARHRAGLTAALTSAGPHPRATLVAAARWILLQHIPDLGRMLNSDMPALPEAEAARLMRLGFEALLVPIAGVFASLPMKPPPKPAAATLYAGAFISTITSLGNLPEVFASQPKAAMAEHLVDVLLSGIAAQHPKRGRKRARTA